MCLIFNLCGDIYFYELSRIFLVSRLEATAVVVLNTLGYIYTDRFEASDVVVTNAL